MGKQVPHNLDAEASLLGALLLRSDLFPTIANSITVGDFYSPGHRVIFTALSNLYSHGQAIDAVGQDREEQAFRRQAEFGEARAVEAAGQAFGGLQAEPGDGPLRGGGMGHEEGGGRRCRGITGGGCDELVQAAARGGIRRRGGMGLGRGQAGCDRACGRARRAGEGRLGSHICSCFVPNSAFRARSQVWPVLGRLCPLRHRAAPKRRLCCAARLLGGGVRALFRP